MNPQHPLSNNRSFLLALCSVVLLPCFPGRAQTEQSTTLMSQRNSDFYVGPQSDIPGLKSTIQSAVTKTCALPGPGSRVIIPAGSPPDRTTGFSISAVTGGCVQAAVEDRPGISAAPYKLITTSTPGYV